MVLGYDGENINLMLIDKSTIATDESRKIVME